MKSIFKEAVGRLKQLEDQKPYETWHELYNYACLTGLDVIAAPVLGNGKFVTWTGSDYRDPPKHHYGEYGLLLHTAEVWNIANGIAQYYEPDICFASSSSSLKLNEETGKNKIDKKVIFLAALYHDIGKTYDYTPNYTPKESRWESAPHKKLFHHITRSVLIWEENAQKVGIEKHIKDHVTHCILSHHGKREWGSPVYPQTPEAWILHFSDSVSARVDESLKGINIKM